MQEVLLGIIIAVGMVAWWVSLYFALIYKPPTRTGQTSRDIWGG
jgi:hypothetical protein